jgi:DNA gyrase subunit A
MGKYHPHGNLAIYDALVRMAQDFSMRVTLVDGQGNFGSVDGDPAAAERYTEVKLRKIAHAMLDDLDKDTVDFRENYDGTLQEPLVLPAAFPNLLVNGAGGIAVGMATNIPPHNLGEVIDACIAHLEKPDISIDELTQIVPGPDFPTGATILGKAGILAAYHKGRGSIVLRAKVHVEELRNGKEALIATAIPYQVNKKHLVEHIGELARDKKIEGVSGVWDESNREGMRIVVELKRDAIADVVLNQLWRFTDMQTTFGANMIALNGGRPEQLTLRDMISAFNAFREEVVTRRIKHLLGKARGRAHVLVGLAIAVANIDEVIRIIRGSASPAEAKEALRGRSWPAKDMAPLIELIADPRHKLDGEGNYRLSEEQATAILALTLSRLTALGRDEIEDELKKLAEEIKDFLDILGSRVRIVEIIRKELTDIKSEFATPRLTEILEIDGDVEDEDLIAREDCVVTVSHKGYIKRVPLSTYRAQRRGGKGRSGMQTREEDVVTQLFVASTHTPLLFFSSRGMCYRMKVWRLPAGTPQSQGKALVNLLPLEQDETITSILPLPEDEKSWGSLELMFATRNGRVRRNSLADFENINRNGKIAMKLAPKGDEEKDGEEGKDAKAPESKSAEGQPQAAGVSSEGGKDTADMDRIVGVAICGKDDDVLLTTANGQAIRFEVGDVRMFKGRDSTGVRGIRLEGDDTVISMAILHHVEATPPERAAYLKQSTAIRRAQTGETEADGASGNGGASSGNGGGSPAAGAIADAEEGADQSAELTPERYAELGGREQFVLTVSERGFGKRTSSYEYRVSGRGGKGIAAMIVNDRNGRLVASFPVEGSDQIMLVTDRGQLIRCPVDDVRTAGRNTQGVRIFRTDQDEKVVSVERISDDGSDPADDAGEAEPGDAS